METHCRAQSVQIGALLLFAFLVVGFSLTQATLVPDENAEVEFNHNQAVQDDLIDLRSNLLRSAVTGESRTSTVTLGTRYPSRALLLNPGPPAGILRTQSTGSVTLQNAVATDDEVSDYLDGSGVSFPTTAVVYEPSYNEYLQAPTTRLQATVLTNQFDAESQVRTEQTLVSGRTLTLIPIVGEFGASQPGSTSVEPTTVSSVERTVTVEEGDDPISVRVETRLSENHWRDLLSEELDSSGYVQSVDCPDAASPTDPCGTLVVTLEPGTEYELRMGEVAMGTTGASVADDADPQYVTTVAADGATVTEGSTRTVTFEVRDQFNNPVSGVTLEITQPQAGSVSNGSASNADGNITAVTNENGQVSVTYRAPLNVDEDRDTSFLATMESPPSDVTSAQASATVAVTAADGSDTVKDENWPHPLIDGVQPVTTSTHTDFVRIYFPNGVDSPSEWALSNGTATTPLPAEADAYSGEHYFVADESRFENNHEGVPTSRVHSLGSISLESSGSIRLVHDGRTVDAFGYEGETVDARPTAAGWSYEFDNGELVDFVAERRVEDSAYVDRNGSADWRSIPESEFLQSDGVSVEAISASTNFDGSADANAHKTNEISFSFAFEGKGDVEIEQVTLNATYVEEDTVKVARETHLTVESGSEWIRFTKDYKMKTESRYVVARIEVLDSNGESRVFIGVIQDAGQTVTFEGGGIDET